LHGNGGFPIENGDEAVAGVFVGGAIENGVVGKKGIAGEIHLGYQARGEGGAENGKVNVGGTPGVVVIAPGIFAGLDGDETVAALVVGEGVAAAGEVGVERGLMLIAAVKITAGGVGLPEFDEGVRDRAAVFIEDAAADDDAFAEGFAGGLASEVAGFDVDEFGAEGRAGDFRKRVGKIDERLFGSAFEAGAIGRMEMRRLGAGIGATIACDVRHGMILLLAF